MEKLILGAFIALPVVYLLHRLLENVDIRQAQDDAVWEAQQLIGAPRQSRFDD